MTGGPRQDLVQCLAEMVRTGACERPAEVQDGRTLSVRDRVADRGGPRFQPAQRIAGRRGEAVAAIPREPQDPERAVGRAVHHRPRGRDAFRGRADAPGPGHHGHALQEDPRSQDDGEHAAGDLPHPERLSRSEPVNEVRPNPIRVAIDTAAAAAKAGGLDNPGGR